MYVALHLAKTDVQLYIYFNNSILPRMVIHLDVLYYSIIQHWSSYIYVTGNVCNQGIHVIPNQVSELTFPVTDIKREIS